MKAVGHEKEDYFLLLVAFQLAYALFEIPAGWLGDTFGPRKTLLRIVIWWSICIAVMSLAGLPLFSTSLAIGYGSLVVIQFLFGIGEAGAFPNIAKALYNWFPASQRAFVQGVIWFSSRLMGGLTPFLWVLLVPVGGISWRLAVSLFAGLGLIWCAVFFLWFRNRPEDHPACNAAERDLIAAGKKTGQQTNHPPVFWRRLIRNPNLWFLCGMYFCSNFGWYFLMYFLPGYMNENFGLSREAEAGAVTAGKQLFIALLTGAPLLLGTIACVWGGVLSDAYIRRTGNRTWGRRLIGMLGYAFSMICYLAAIFFQGNPVMIAVCVALVGFGSDLTLGPAWATAQDVGRRYAATISGCMNMIGNIGAALGNYTTGIIIRSYKESGQLQDGYILCLSLYAAAYGIGIFFWWLVDANKPLVDD